VPHHFSNKQFVYFAPPHDGGAFFCFWVAKCGILCYNSIKKIAQKENLVMSEFLASLHPIVVCLIVCGAKIVEITIQSLKTCMMVKGQRLKAAGLGFLECTIWGLVISTIIGTLGDNLFLLLFYCAGYATGLFLGSTIEGKIALGTSNLELIANEVNTKRITAYLKSHNRGYTVFQGHGSKDKMNMIFIVLPRRETPKVLREIRRICNNKVFVVASEVSKYAGGYGMVK
jgi:uncharacterized protein YebE (UPF0316 family)